MPDISIIIPVYNGEKSIHLSLESLLKQTYKNFEVLIIDDGSNDNTSEIIKKFTVKDNRFKYTFQNNAGVAMARNKGIDLAKGRYICFLDSDDYYDHSYLEKMLFTITSTYSDVCYCGYKIVTPSGIKEKRTKFKSGNILLDYILGIVAVQTSGWMISRVFIQKNKIYFPVGISWGEDFEFFCEVLAQTNKVSYVKDYITNYRFNFNKDQLSNFSMDKIDKDFESIKRVQSNRIITRDIIVEQALINYRLSALLTYHLLNAFKSNVTVNEIHCYFDKYKEYISKFSWNNGLRSLKLNIKKTQLFYLLKKK